MSASCRRRANRQPRRRRPRQGEPACRPSAASSSASAFISGTSSRRAMGLTHNLDGSVSYVILGRRVRSQTASLFVLRDRLVAAENAVVDVMVVDRDCCLNRQMRPDRARRERRPCRPCRSPGARRRSATRIHRAHGTRSSLSLLPIPGRAQLKSRPAPETPDSRPPPDARAC